MDAVTALNDMDGAAHWTALAARGVSRGALLRAVTRGDVIRPARGMFAMPWCPPGVERSVEFGAPLTCVSAFAQWGVPLMQDPTAIHLAVGTATHVDQQRARDRGVVVHRGDYVRPERGPWRLPGVHPAAAIKAATLCLSRRDHLVAADALLHAGLLNERDLDFSGGGTRERSLWLRAMADRRAESPLESIARLELVEGGLRVVPQARFRGIGRVDLLVEGAVVVETDGREFHDNDDAFERDRARDRALHARGLVVVRFTRKEVVSTPGLVLADTLRVLGALRSRAA